MTSVLLKDAVEAISQPGPQSGNNGPE